MNRLDDPNQINKFNNGKIVESIIKLPNQGRDAWEEISKINFPQECLSCENVVISGMGGSALGGRIVDSLMIDRARTPIEVSTEFKLPGYANGKTLVILSSYSGNTEETLTAAHDAFKRGCRVFGIATGGKLSELLSKDSHPAYIYEPKNNPSNQPRMGLGYSIVSILSVLSKGNFIHLTEEELFGALSFAEKIVNENIPEISSADNFSKLLAGKLKGKIPVLIASEHLTGVAHALKNQLNENSKNFSVLFDIPELNHHLLEGLKFPFEGRRFLSPLFFKSSLYSPGVLKRYPLTVDVMEQNGYVTESLTLRGETKLDQIFEALIIGSFVAFYLAVLNGIDPTPIPWVDYFKAKLSPNAKLSKA